jgi:acyl-CoA thioesterase
MKQTELSEKITTHMYNHDAFSKWLGIERLEIEAGHCVLRMQVRAEMTNGFGIAHGGITYSLADSALAFAANGHGRMAVSIETSISHIDQVAVNDILTATAQEESCTNKIGIYSISIRNQNNEVIALFKGTVYRTAKEWFS